MVDPAIRSATFEQGTCWYPIKMGLAVSRELVKANVGVIEFKVTSTIYRLFAHVWLWLGVVMLVAGVDFIWRWYGSSEPVTVQADHLANLVLAPWLVLYGELCRRSHNSPIVFDRGTATFSKGRERQNARSVFSKSILGSSIFRENSVRLSLSDIYALQIIYVKGSSSDNPTYWQLNVIAKDSRRIFVNRYNIRASIEQDARTLGAFLDVPVLSNC